MLCCDVHQPSNFGPEVKGRLGYLRTIEIRAHPIHRFSPLPSPPAPRPPRNRCPNQQPPVLPTLATCNSVSKWNLTIPRDPVPAVIMSRASAAMGPNFTLLLSQCIIRNPHSCWRFCADGKTPCLCVCFYSIPLFFSFLLRCHFVASSAGAWELTASADWQKSKRDMLLHRAFRLQPWGGGIMFTLVPIELYWGDTGANLLDG